MTDPRTIAAGLSEARKRELARVCRTNGGGVYIRCKVDAGEVVPANPLFRKLFDAGLVQGKAGAYETLVHTREGLAVYRAILQEQDNA